MCRTALASSSYFASMEPIAYIVSTTVLRYNGFLSFEPTARHIDARQRGNNEMHFAAAREKVIIHERFRSEHGRE